jgi:3-oxoacyl-[acyl-carrier protein] reductase
VLGGGGGLGRAIAVSLAREGARVTVADISAEALEGTRAAVAAVGGEAHALVWDLSDLGAIDGRVRAAEERHGPVQILVNNTGGPPPTPSRGRIPRCGGRTSR